MIYLIYVYNLAAKYGDPGRVVENCISVLVRVANRCTTRYQVYNALYRDVFYSKVEWRLLSRVDMTVDMT